MSKLYLSTNEDVGDKSLVEALTDKGFDDTPISKVLDEIEAAIHNKDGSTDYIPASEMAERIANLPSGGIDEHKVTFISMNPLNFKITVSLENGDEL